MRNLVFGVLITLAAVRQQPASNPEVYLADLGPVANPAFDGTLVNISNSPGYDNQPSFTPDGKAILFSSVRGDTQWDIYRYDIATKALTNLTRSPENENSPLVTPDGKTFSAVRTEMDKTQRLWRFNLDGSNPQVILENVKPVGYHVWIDATHLALFVLGGQGQPNTLQLADTATGTADVIDTNIGRSLLMRPGSTTVSYVSKKTTPWTVNEFDPKNRVILPVTGPLGPELDRVEDCAWDPAGRLIMAKGSIVWVLPFAPKFGGRAKLADFSSAGIDKITRLATNVSGGRLRLALVAEPVAK
jgi:dipeptidyl aminopeptidase/acylaminoacyl peptidase